jgi:alkylhydroperoxidase/carboxymuconolactone decarboxylase family protein YurZ
LVAGTILLNNMSAISMIPIELRRRRIERAVLTQFGDELDDVALRELATGPLIQRLRLSANRPDGLDECTREMFSLAMLVRLGKVSETDIRESFAAFRRLDVNNEGILNSKSIIAALIQKRTGITASTSMTNLHDAATHEGKHPPRRIQSYPGEETLLHSYDEQEHVALENRDIGYSFDVDVAEQLPQGERTALLQNHRLATAPPALESEM